MLKRLLFFCLTLLFFISATSNVSADNKIIRKKTVRNVVVTTGNRLTIQQGGKTYNTTLQGGIEDVFPGGVSNDAVVKKGGKLWLAGGKSYGATVKDGGRMEVREHRKNSSYSANTEIFSGGKMNVFNRSLAEKITVHKGGLLRVYLPKSLINDVTVLSGGVLHVWKHGTAQNVYVAPGGLLDLREESPVLKGTIRIAGQLKASFDQTPDVRQAKIILDLTKRRTSNIYYIKNLDFLNNSNISVNIAHNQKTGLYKIASGATRWNDKLDITVDGQKIQSIRLWKPVKIAGKYYTLKRVNYKFIGLTVSLTPPASNELVSELEISQKHEKKKRKNDKVQRPVKQKIIPTFEENLSPAQVTRKIQTIRKRIETAPENIISNKDKPFLLEIFDDITQTQMGRYIFEKTHPNLMFCVKPLGSNASYAFGPKCINLNKNLYFKENQTPEERCKKRLYLSKSIAHEATHGLQHVNNMLKCGKISFEERITITKICELHALLNQSITTYQLSKQPHYKEAVKAGKTEIAPFTLFYAELFDAYKTTGLSDAKAAKAARTKFVETFWQNNGEKSIQIGEKTVFPCEEFIQSWHISYSTFGFRGLQGNKTPYREAMRHRGIERFLRRFTQSMDIDTPPSFFRNPQTTAFHMPTSKRLLTYANGILNTEMDALTTGMITKGYRSGIQAKGRKKGEPYYILIKTLHPQIASQDRSHTEYHEGTNIKRATYTYKNGKMNGIYREYDLQGRQIMEVPVQNDNVNGEGWVMENGKKVLKTFFNKALLRNR